MKVGVGVLYRHLSSQREVGDYERWRGHSFLMTNAVISSHILEIKNAYAKWRSAPLAVLLPNVHFAFTAEGRTGGIPYLSGDIFLGTFAEFQKATIRFVMSARLSVRMEQLGCHWPDFHEIWYFRIFRKSVEIIQVSLKPEKNNGYFTWRPTYFFVISRSILFIMKNVPDKICRDTRNIYFVK